MSNKIGREKHVVTDERRATARYLATIGRPQVDIAKKVGCCARTLRKCYRVELDEGMLEANIKVSSTLYDMATSGKNTAATIFWAKTRSGFREEAAPEAKPPRQRTLKPEHEKKRPGRPSAYGLRAVEAAEREGLTFVGPDGKKAA